jgi:arginine decarboxylase
MVPKKVFFTKGVGVDKEKLKSFESALRDANIARYNLVKVSSIFPPNCKIVSKKKGVELLSPGSIVFCVMSENATTEPNRLMASSVGCAQPTKGEHYGYLSEHHSFGENAKVAGDYAEDLAASMLASTLGLEFDPEKAWDERKQEYKMSGEFVKTINITQTAKGNIDGLWTTVVAAAIFVFK